MATYDKNKDYQALMDAAAAAGKYKDAATLEQERNAKITGEGLNYGTTNSYGGWLDPVDHSTILQQQMASGADASDVSGTLDQRMQKASSTKGMEQYVYDDVSRSALDYIKNNLSGGLNYNNASAYTGKYDSQLDQLVQQLLNREDFSYDAANDPLYNMYEQSYTRNGQRAMQDTIGEVSARTGGLASSYAATAGAQANNVYMSQLADKIPELQQLAYSMYQDQGDDMLQNADLLSGLNENDYQKYLDTIEQQRYADETSYDRGLDERATAEDRASMLASIGDFSGYADLYDLSDEELASFQNAFAAANAPSTSGGGGGDDDTDGLFAKLASFGNDADAYAYLVSLGYAASKTEKLWEFYENMPDYSDTLRYDDRDEYDSDVRGAYEDRNSYKAEAVMTKSQWQSAKDSGSKDASVANYNTYEDFIKAYNEYMTIYS